MSDFFGGGNQSGGGLTGGMGNAAKLAAGALLIHQLMKHAQGQPSQSQGGMMGAGPAAGGGGLGGLLGGLMGGGASPMASGMSTAGTGGLGGGLGGLLGGLLGGGGGSPMGGAMGGGLGSLMAGGGLGGLLGGLGGMLGSLRSQGLGQHVDSWVSHGPNQEVSPQELERGFDPQELDEAARHAGTDRGTLLQEMSGLLPQLVDRATPQGNMPQRDEDLGHGGIGGLLGGLLGGAGGQSAGTMPNAGPGSMRRG